MSNPGQVREPAGADPLLEAQEKLANQMLIELDLVRMAVGAMNRTMVLVLVVGLSVSAVSLTVSLLALIRV